MYCDASTMTDPNDYGSDVDENATYFVKNEKQIHTKYLRPDTGVLEPFQVNWKDLTYKVSNRFGLNKTILNGINGFFKSGHMTAIMGPSGSGKSTLLDCISGLKKNGLSGSISISTKRQINLAFIPQDDYLFEKLKINESLIYASKLKNNSSVDHTFISKAILKKLNLIECSKNRPGQCSGGQRKRISIALELVSRPNILILDEPTSGLDTTTTWQLINTLKKMTKVINPVAVVLTIHQPSAKLLQLFDGIYIMSNEGQCIYHGSALRMTDFFEKYGLICPKYYNPSDFALEIAVKEHGMGIVMMLTTVTRIENLDLKTFDNSLTQNFKFNTLRHIRILTVRTFLLTIRDPYLFPIRLSGYLLCATLIALLYGSKSGKLSGCAEDFTVGMSGDVFENYKNVWARVYQNFSCIFFILMSQWFCSMFPILLTLPKEIHLFLKEFKNGYYSCFSLLMSKILVEIPFLLIIPTTFSLFTYLMTGQYTDEEWRIYYFILIGILLSLNASSSGLMISAMFMEYPSAAAFAGVLTIIPLCLFSGFMNRYDDMPLYFQWISFGNYMRFGLESSLIDIYGFNRCEKSSRFNQTNIDLTELIPLDKINRD